MKKILGLALLPVAAIGMGMLTNVQKDVVVKADEEVVAVPFQPGAVYDKTFDNLSEGGISPQALFENGLYAAQDHVDYTIRSTEINGEKTKVMDMTIIGDDGGGYAKMLIVGSDGGLTQLVPGKSYTMEMYLDLTQMTGGTLFFEIAVKAKWHGITLTKDGVVNVCDPAGNFISNLSYNKETKILKFTFKSYEESTDTGVRPYGHFTMANAENSDVISLGELKIYENIYALNQDFETVAENTHFKPKDESMLNFYSEALPDSKVVKGDDGNKYLNVVFDNTQGSENIWKGFYINRLNETLKPAISGHTYRLSMDVLANNSREMYIKYNDSGDDCNTFLPNGTIASLSEPGKYLSNPYWDGTKLSQDILFDSEKNEEWWPQVYVEFCIPAETMLDVKIDNIKVVDITEYGVSDLVITPAKDSFTKGQDFTAENLSVKGVIGTSQVTINDFTVDASSYNKNEVGEYDINVSITDGIFSVNKSYKVNVHNDVTSVSLKSAPTKTVYKYGEDLDLTGAQIEVVREDNSKETITVTSEMVSGYNKNNVGEQTISVSYLEHTFTFKVTVNDYVTGIVLKNAPATTVNYGEEIDLTNAQITVSKASGATNDVAITASMLSGFNKTTLGDQIVTVTYETFTTTFTIKVVDFLKTISVKTQPTKVQYELNEELDLTGAKLETTTAAGVKNELDITSEMVTGFDSTSAGEKTLTVTYEGLTTTFKVTVKAPYVPEPEEKTGCGGSIIATCGIISALALVGASLIQLKKKED